MKLVNNRDYEALFKKAMDLVNEAESNILDAYEGTSDEPRIRNSYKRKRSALRSMRRHALGLTR